MPVPRPDRRGAGNAVGLLRVALARADGGAKVRGMRMQRQRRWWSVLAVIATTAASVLVAAGPARADDSSEFPSCTYYWTGIGAAYGGGTYTGSGDWYAYGPQLTSPSGSACEDIQIVAPYSMSPNMRFRVRFFPSGGGSFANSWKQAGMPCWSCAWILATSVANGTVWRVEGVDWVWGCPGCTQTVVTENFDLNA